VRWSTILIIAVICEKNPVVSKLGFIFLFVFFGKLESVGHSFAYVANLYFLTDVWIRTQGAAARYQVSHPSPSNVPTHPSKEQQIQFQESQGC
jgi:hypothetical protein